jgi:hypothetical protein
LGDICTTQRNDRLVQGIPSLVADFSRRYPFGGAGCVSRNPALKGLIPMGHDDHSVAANLGHDQL